MDKCRLPTWIPFASDHPRVPYQKATSIDSKAQQRYSPIGSYKKHDRQSSSLKCESTDQFSPRDESHLEKTLDTERMEVLQLLSNGNQDVNFSEIKARICRCPQMLQPIRCVSFCQGNMDEENPFFTSAKRSDIDLCRPTILGALCAGDFSGHEMLEVIDLITCIIELCPVQLQCSQLIRGHTPFRAACRNESCGPEILSILVQADQRHSFNSSVIYLSDHDGLTPIDHIVRSVHLNPYGKALERLRVLMDRCNSNIFPYPAQSNPLFHLFSTDITMDKNTTFLSTEDATSYSSEKEYQLQRILEISRALLTVYPELIGMNSPFTGCSPLHVAIRNYGNFAPLIQQLILEAGSDLAHRNIFLDLPIHVACSVGVPMDVLRIIIEHTLLAEGRYPPFSLVWSCNAAGFTPFDLEWIRHIEVGHGFFSNRLFYPLETSGVWGVQRSFYRDLLRRAVNQVVGAPSVSSTVISPINVKNNDSMGLLIDRILLLIQAAFPDSYPRNLFDLKSNILHKASALCGPFYPTLPTPIMELILWQYPEQIDLLDDKGKLPLHYALQVGRQDEPYADRVLHDWCLWLKILAQSWPKACSIKDRNGRLPLHYALDFPCRRKSLGKTPIELHNERVEIILDLVSLNPESLEQADPVTKLYPFQQAAADSFISLECVYILLRHTPSSLHGCCSQIPNKTKTSR